MHHRLTRVGLFMVFLACAAGPAQALTYTPIYIETSKAFGTAVAKFSGSDEDDFFVCGHDEYDAIWNSQTTGGMLGYVKGQELEPPGTIHTDRHDCDAADVNHDGRADFYVAVGAGGGDGYGSNQLWLQDALGVFHQKGNHGAEDPLGSSRRPIFFNFNDDEFPDLYVTSEQHCDPGDAGEVCNDSNPSPNRLFINMHPADDPNLPMFQEVTNTLANDVLGWGCVAKGLVSNDTLEDLLICNDDDHPTLQSVLLVHEQASADFIKLTPAALANKKVTWAVLRDLNGDNKADLLFVTGQKLHIWLNTGISPYFDGSAARIYELGALGKSLTVGDFNHDGHLDIYVARASDTCMSKKNPDDDVPDMVFWGLGLTTWAPVVLNEQGSLLGCAHEVQTLDGDKVLLVNGNSKSGRPGDNLVIRWTN